MDETAVCPHPEPWNKGKLVGQKAPFKLKEIWAIRVRLQLFRRARDLALFKSKLSVGLSPALCGHLEIYSLEAGRSAIEVAAVSV